MRKFVLVLIVLLLAAPTWAAVTVNCTAVNPGNSYEVRVSYTADANNVRAYGIRIDVNNGATISNIDVNDKDYYIFPGSIDINDTTGDVNDYGSAVAEGGNGQSYMILEMGSLYAATDPCHTTAPASSGTICTFDVSKECVVSLSRDTDRGGVVMENGSDYASLGGCSLTYAHCFPQSDPCWAQYDLVGRPDSWCGKKQCHGDADNAWQNFGRDLLVAVGSNDFAILAIGYNRNDYSGSPYVDGDDPDSEPDTWIAADFTHAAETFGRDNYVRVSSADFAILAEYYNDPCDTVPADCMP